MIGSFRWSFKIGGNKKGELIFHTIKCMIQLSKCSGYVIEKETVDVVVKIVIIQN